MGWIYKITNKINNKVYIGQTINSLEKRFKQHLSEAKQGKNCRLHSAIRKYGIDAFVIEPIEKVENEFLNERERYYISLYDTTNTNNGYNMDAGGQSGWGLHPRSGRYERKVCKYTLDGEYIETYQSIKICAEKNNTHASIISLCVKGDYKSWNGYQYKYEGDMPLKKVAVRGSRAVNQLSKTGEFIATYPSLTAAAKAVGLKTISYISECCNGKAKTSGGFKWEWAD